MGSNNSYKKLLSTTMILAVGSFSSKVLVFLMMPFYTRVLSTTQFGTTNLIQQASNLLIPLASVGIANSVIRFGLDKDSNKNAVFTTGLLTVLGGFGLLACFSPLLSKIKAINGYTALVLLYVLSSALHSVCAQFIQAKKYTKLYALDGILRTIFTISLNILLLVVFQMGVMGYVLATIIADLLSTIFLWFMASLGRYFSISSLNRHTTFAMLKYSIPLIPTMVCVWVISMSDQFMIEYYKNSAYGVVDAIPNTLNRLLNTSASLFKIDWKLSADYSVGSAAVGIYSVSNRVPQILSIVASIFGDAWQISIVSEDPEKQRKFFSNVFATYQCIALLGASGLIMTTKIVVTLLAAPSYFIAWRYIPVLLLGIVCSCLGTFLSSIYMVEKQSIYTLFTMALGAGGNVLLNVLLIPRMGILGAAVATCLSYFLMFSVRAIHTRKFIPVRWNMSRFLPSALLVVLQAALMMLQVPYWGVWQVLIFTLVLALNAKDLMRSLMRFF